jgi:HD superfamily phosphohydrolase
VYHVVRTLLENIRIHQPHVVQDLGPDRQEWICLAGLLHDIGHGPFSHLFDEYLHMDDQDQRWNTHEKRTLDILSHMNQKYSLVPEEAIAFIHTLIDPTLSTETQWYSYLIHNPHSGVDMDKMDYLVRDNLQFGLCMAVDMERILQNCRVMDRVLCFRDKVQDELWNMFLIRHRLHSTIYRHPRICKFEKELHCILILMEDKEDFKGAIAKQKAETFLSWTDDYILSRADPVKLHEFHTRTSRLVNTKERPLYRDDQFPKLNHLWFYHQDQPGKFHLPFPSIYCPFSIPT